MQRSWMVRPVLTVGVQPAGLTNTLRPSVWEPIVGLSSFPTLFCRVGLPTHIVLYSTAPVRCLSAGELVVDVYKGVATPRFLVYDLVCLNGTAPCFYGGGGGGKGVCFLCVVGVVRNLCTG
jgi:hypothetical protein